ncbi:ATP-sulfurylase 3, chloroplastic-like [Salvia hispanica]|uniref:ATP-sulfurylase 3, chloroplastic-like n=1 Tax=Salvia hispanica TaxID=49212 RepID=UPI00200920E2|nr:ATP-sulfurylase 3, chloroplastic-like [Salvia hispanica]
MDQWLRQRNFGDLNILPFKVVAYDKTQSKMAFFDSSRAHDFVFISGTKMRSLAKTRESPPDGFMCLNSHSSLYYNFPRYKLHKPSKRP